MEGRPGDGIMEVGGDEGAGHGIRDDEARAAAAREAYDVNCMWHFKQSGCRHYDCPFLHPSLATRPPAPDPPPGWVFDRRLKALRYVGI